MENNTQRQHIINPSLMDNNFASSMESTNQEINTDNFIVPEMEEIWRRASDSNEIEALFQMLKSELLTNEGDSQSVDNNYANNDQLAYLNSSENNDLLEEIFAETQPNECTIQNDAADERQAILMDFDCSVFECKSEVDDNKNFVWSQDSEVQAMAHV